MTFESLHDFNWYHDTSCIYLGGTWLRIDPLFWHADMASSLGIMKWFETVFYEKYPVFRLKIHVSLKYLKHQNWKYMVISANKYHALIENAWFVIENFLWPSCLLSRTVYFSKIINISPKLKISRLIILLFNIILWCVVFKWGCHLPAILCIFHFPTLACTLFPVLKDLPIVAPEWPLIREWDLKEELSSF